MRTLTFLILSIYFIGSALGQVNIGVDAGITLKVATANHYGINYQRATDPSIAQMPTLRAKQQKLTPSLSGTTRGA
ncbi:MAG: hypothetical protein HC896_11970 [Bacteroidales bacterium]|nr:hypothetical protein [Bacteroidales bacterium]